MEESGAERIDHGGRRRSARSCRMHAQSATARRCSTRCRVDHAATDREIHL
jgi:hypothetical protein